MIRPLNVEIKIIVYIIAYGIYYFAVSDFIIYLEDHYKLKKIPKLILEFIYLIMQIFITYNFCYKLESGYIPIYFLLFIIIGFLLYYLFMREYFIKTLKIISKYLAKGFNYLKPVLKHLLYSTTIIKKISILIKEKITKLKLVFKKEKNINQNN